jgi:hypothetical protein
MKLVAFLMGAFIGVCLVGDGKAPLQFVNRSPSVCTVDANGLVTATANGIAKVDVVTGIGTRRWEQLMLANQTAVSAPQFQGYVAGSLAKHIVDQMAALISGKVPSDDTLNTFASNRYGINAVNINGDNQAPDAVWNPNNFAAAIDLTGMTVGTFYGGIFPAALVSPRHVIRAKHVSSQGKCVWKGTDGNFYSANIVRSQALTGDICVGYLDAAIPATVKPFKVLPSNYASYLPSVSKQALPALSKRYSGGDKLRILEFWIMQNQGIYSSTFAVNTNSVPVAGSQFAPWFSPIIDGDSSSPQWFVINGEAVILNCLWNPSGGTHYGDYVPQIEAAMNALKDAGDGTTYSLLHPTLSSFPTY